MNLVAGYVLDIMMKNGTKMAKVKLKASVVCVTLALPSDVGVGDAVLVDSGVAVAKIQNRIEEED